MNWFDEQIRQRIEQDDDLFDDAFLAMASAVLGKGLSHRLRDQHVMAKDAIGEVLKFYNKKPVEVPESIRDFDDQLEYMLRPYGIMHRSVQLAEGWYHDAYGPMIGQRGDGALVALLPKGLMGYVYVDPDTGEQVRIGRKNQNLIRREAVCFYRSFPLKKMTIRRLLVFIWESLDFRDYALLVLAVLATTILGMFNPMLSHALTGRILKSGSLHLLGAAAFFMVTTTISTIVFTTIRDLISRSIEIKMDLSVNSAAMMRILSLPAEFFRQYSSGNLSERLEAMSELCNLLMSSLFSTGIISLASLLYITQIFAFAPGLTVPAMALIACEVIFAIATALLQQRVSELKMENQATESGLSYAMLSGIRKLRLAGAEKRAFARWAKVYSKVVKYEYDPPVFLKMNSVFSQMLALFGTILIYYLAVKNGLSAADYYAFEAAYAMVMTAFTTMAGMALSVATIRPVLNMVYPILAQQPEIQETKEIVTKLYGAMEMEGVSFRYTEAQPPVLEDFSLRIRAGEYVAIVGRTGCGKSTLMRLLLGFEKPQKGAIYYDRKNIDNMDLKSLRRKVGAVMQNGGVFSGSIYDNIAISSPGLSLEEAWEAAEMAGLAEDIREMPMGMHTMLAEDGGGISGGQKQRLMIARAVAPKPKILMFDEATSALDNATQRQVSEALDALDCTRLIIAHRLSTVKNCDRIIVMGEGGIMEQGTYQELMDKKGDVCELVQRQQI